ncbi:SoxW family protein [Helicobacter cappadocius]|uniref:Thioredoxin fold domain-containing protein n=1 Tax=Helicobacter cappadocius TaxID=3063998 RepID=A0AA90Q2Y3_9HELI|nr:MULTISPECIES: thioredoxin fold domain-containing protein [unclassified Helicobacter]MDO7253249.1 thioredoxin fold domain-containing protein [Helicobacter sp. faydin-H75]MDP2539173.1 thioredoxin fold domain-containing protein [Helicobacter sp. faydin-H76]
MKKIFLMAITLVILGMFSISLSGCNSDNKVDSSIISDGSNTSSKVSQESENLDKNSYAGLEDVFGDTKFITPNGKYMMMVFGANGCPYCEALKKDIKDTPSLKKYIQDNFTAYYINMSYSKIHDFKVGTPNDPKEIQVSTAQLSRMYDIRPTPTIVFSDTDGKTILEFPGYMPEKQFMAMLEFIATGEWKKAKDQRQINQLLQEYVMKKSNS